MLPAARKPLADFLGQRRGMGASLDHALWLHRAPRPEEWIYFHRECVSVRGARALVRGELRHPDGALLASVIQESLNRV